MPQTIHTITTKTLLAAVNCYLLQSGSDYLLIDTGWPNQQAIVEQGLANAGCAPGRLKLILLTHGHFDHAGSAAYLRDKFGAKIAMHPADVVMVQSGDMFANTNVRPLMRRLMGLIMAVLGGGSFRRFQPDVLLNEGDDLAAYGFDGQIYALPGHSKGSIGILTSAGDLIGGDLFTNNDKPQANSLRDDAAALNASVARVKALPVHTIYPGHGRPFPLELLAAQPAS